MKLPQIHPEIFMAFAVVMWFPQPLISTQRFMLSRPQAPKTSPLLHIERPNQGLVGAGGNVGLLGIVQLIMAVIATNSKRYNLAQGLFQLEYIRPANFAFRALCTVLLSRRRPPKTQSKHPSSTTPCTPAPTSHSGSTGGLGLLGLFLTASSRPRVTIISFSAFTSPR